MTDKAILFGINQYKSISHLQGCLNDLEDIRRLLIDDFDFSDDCIRIYRNAEVVRQAVEEGFAWLAYETDPGSRLVFHFSGHGSYTKSKSSNKEVDELLCLYDMSWRDEKSFIRDSDLGKLTQKIASEARLTVILDSCHSGTGTRAFSPNLRSLARTTTVKSPLVIVADSAARLAQQQGTQDVTSIARGIATARAATLAQLRTDETPPVFARFVSPPASVVASINQTPNMRVRSLGQTLQSKLNHQLLAAAGEKQTAADAFIDGQYRGAFSFNLCATARLNSSRSFDEVMKLTKQRIKQQGFSQDPQMEGPFTQEPLFGAPKKSTSDGPATSPQIDHTVDQQPIVNEPAQGLTTTGCGGCKAEVLLNNSSRTGGAASAPADALQTLQQLLRVTEKLVDLAKLQSTSVAEPVSSPLARSTDSQVIIYVHGISEHLPGYSKVWHEALSRHLLVQLRTAEVRWSQLVNARSVDPTTNPLQAIETEDLKANIEAELQRRTDRLESAAQQRNASQSAVRGATEIGIERPRSFLVDDFTRYMLSESTREAILKEFFKIVVPELEAGRKVHIISHSWGTVVSYEGLRRLDDRRLPGRVANLFTAGSALSIGPVQYNLFGRVSNGRMPVHVDRIINLDAGGDVVGGAIGNEFTVDREYLGLDPTGCRKIPFTGLALNPACAHRSYFLPDNIAVNREIFAAYINQAP